MSVLSPVELPDLKTFESTTFDATKSILIRGSPRKDDDVYFKDGLVNFSIRDGGGCYTVSANNLLLNCPRVLYYNIAEPLIRISLVERSHLLLHSACVTKNDKAYLIVAMPDTGKTSTVVSLCSCGRFEIMDDDMTIVTPDGTCLAFPKDLTLSMRLTRYVRPDSVMWPLKLSIYSGTVRRMVKRLSGGGGSLVFANVLMQSLFPPPKARLVLPETLSGELGGIFCLERGELTVHKLPRQESLQIITRCNEEAFGFPPYSKIFPELDGFRDFVCRERELLERVLDGTQVFLLRDHFGWPELIERQIDLK